MATKKSSTTTAGNAAKLKEQWHDAFDELADAQNLFQAINALVQEARTHIDHEALPALIALEAVAEKGLRSTTGAWNVFEAIKDGRSAQPAAGGAA